MKFKESESAHKYCIGHGLEIGGSAHNPFGLNTRNVDITTEITVFKQSEIDLCGEYLPVDIIAYGDNIPVPSESEDFIISSHVLEHFDNPIKALLEWDRIIKPGGIIFMIVPHMQRTFDRDRKRTLLRHVINDFIGEIDDYHEEVKKHGHNHVWITEDVVEIINWMQNNLDLSWKIEEIQDIDDKVGNGFTIVIRKEKPCMT